MFRWIMDRKGGWIALAVIAVVLFFAANASVTNVAGMRVDLTEDKLYTLSPGTRSILGKLEKPVSLTLYYSDKLGLTSPVYGNYASRLKDMLSVFESAGAGKVTLEIKEPKPFSEIEDKAVELGMQGVPLDQTGEKVYFGLVAKADGKQRNIPFMQIERENFLEYDVASLIYRLGSGSKTVVAVYTDRPLFGDLQMQMRGIPTQPYAVVQQMQDQFDVRQIFTLEEIWKEKPDVLMLVHPGDLDDEDYYNLDQYMLRGGKAIVFVDPFNESAAARQRGIPQSIASDLKRMLDHWGVEIVKDRVAGDRRFAPMVNAGNQQQVIPAPFLTWMNVKREGLSATDAVTSNINQLNIRSAGILRSKKDAALRFEPLVTTTQESQAVDLAFLRNARPQILKIIESFKPSGENLVVAARLNGKAKTMFPDGPPKKKEEKKAEMGTPEKATEKPKDDAGKTSGEAAKPETAPTEPAVKADRAERDVAQAAPSVEQPAKADPAAENPAEKPAATDKPAADKPAESGKAAAKEGEKKKEEAPKAPPFIAEATGPMNVILVSDADLLEDRFWVQSREFFGQRVRLPFANNADFVVNAIENLAGGDDLISLRSRGTAQRPFTKIQELQLTAEQKFRAEERELQKKLEDAEKKLAELQKKKAEGASDATVDKAVEATAEKFTQEILATRKELRRVQLALREDIESLETWLRFVNIGLIPILVGVVAMGLGAARHRRRRRGMQAPEG
jgi:gliding motility-associatede transport system auxiliary component